MHSVMTQLFLYTCSLFLSTLSLYWLLFYFHLYIFPLKETLELVPPLILDPHLIPISFLTLRGKSQTLDEHINNSIPLEGRISLQSS